MDVSEQLTRRLVELWLAWQDGKPSHQRLFFNFHEEVVARHRELDHLTLLDTLAVLNSLSGTATTPVQK